MAATRAAGPPPAITFSNSVNARDHGADNAHRPGASALVVVSAVTSRLEACPAMSRRATPVAARGRQGASPADRLRESMRTKFAVDLVPCREAVRRALTGTAAADRFARPNRPNGILPGDCYVYVATVRRSAVESYAPAGAHLCVSDKNASY